MGQIQVRAICELERESEIGCDEEEDSEIIAPVAFLAALYDSECESDFLEENDVEEESSHGPEFYGLLAADSDSGTNSEDESEDKKFDYGFSSDDEEESS